MSSARTRPGAIVLAAICVLALIGVAVAAALDRRDLAFTNGVPILGLVTEPAPGQVACQRAVSVRAAFRIVRLAARGVTGPRPALSVDLSDSLSGHGLRHAVAPPGHPGEPLRLELAVAQVPAGGRIDVCVRNRGEVDLGLDGGKAESVPDSPLFVAGERNEHSALALDFLRGEPRSVLSQVPLIMRRAAIFRPRWVGAWTFWLLAALVAVAVPALLARALADVED